MQTVYKKTFFISANESNPEGELAVNILISNIIEIATLHANSLGIGNPVMEHLHAGWVLSRLTVEMKEYPKVNTEYTILTWVESWNRHFSVRDFEIIDSRGHTVGYSRSVWMVLNMLTHDNFGLSHLSIPDDIVSDRPCPIERQAKHLDIHPYGSGEEKNGSICSNVPDTLYTFKYNDIDFYRHVNTVRYLTLLLNSYSLEQFDRAFLSRIELSFLHEGNFGETVAIRRHVHNLPEDSELNSMSSFSLYSSAKSQPLLFARCALSNRIGNDDSL